MYGIHFQWNLVRRVTLTGKALFEAPAQDLPWHGTSLFSLVPCKAPFWLAGGHKVYQSHAPGVRYPAAQKLGGLSPWLGTLQLP